VRAFFKDDDFNFLTEIALGAVYHRAADVGEVLSTIERIHNGKPRTWVDAWTATAERLEAEAGSAADAGHAATAAAQHLRVSMYWSLASCAADGTGDESLFASLWERHRQAWDRFVDLTDVHIERVEIPYEDTTLPGYFFRTGGPDEARRTFIFNNGSDGAVTNAWVQGIADAVARGWNAVTFDGPGQNAALVRQGLFFRPDWEHVITPVVDHLVARPDVDADRLALLGVSQGGYWVPRAVAFEHRIAAAVADPGVMDVSYAMWSQLPHYLTKHLEAGEQAKFDHDMQTVERFVKTLGPLMTFRGRPYGTSSPYELFTAAREYQLTEEVLGQIRCPLLVTDPDNEQFWPGQSQALHDGLAGEKAIVRFTEDEGADSHCEPAGNAVRGERIFDWLDEQVPATV
jgi:hypothetical protein